MIQFFLIIVYRFCEILLRKNRSIELIYLDYTDKNIFDSGFIILNYRFRNALWYRFGNHKTLEKQIKIFNLKNLDKEFDLIVYGFFQKYRYKLKFEPQLTLNTDSFKIQFYQLFNPLCS